MIEAQQKIKKDEIQSSEEEEMQEVSKSNEDESFIFDPTQKQRNFAMLTNNESLIFFYLLSSIF